MANKLNRSPLFYVGDKYKLLNEILPYFPKDVDRFIEPFTGGGSVFLNVEAKKHLLNFEFLIKPRYFNFQLNIDSRAYKLEEIMRLMITVAKVYNQELTPLQVEFTAKTNCFNRILKELASW